MTVEQTLMARVSRRSYIAKIIEPHIKSKLVKRAKQLGDACGVRIELVEHAGKAFTRFGKSYGLFSGVNNFFALIAPNNDEFAKEKLGFCGELLVLEATAFGLGTCWVGGTFDKENCPCTINNDEYLACVITVGYCVEKSGLKESLIHRFMRRGTKTIEQLYTANSLVPGWFLSGMQSIRNAPSAFNRQPVRLHYENETISISVPDNDAYQQLDLGIAKAHFSLLTGGKWTLGNNATLQKDGTGHYGAEIGDAIDLVMEKQFSFKNKSDEPKPTLKSHENDFNLEIPTITPHVSSAVADLRALQATPFVEVEPVQSKIDIKPEIDDIIPPPVVKPIEEKIEKPTKKNSKRKSSKSPAKKPKIEPIKEVVEEPIEEKIIETPVEEVNEPITDTVEDVQENAVDTPVIEDVQAKTDEVSIDTPIEKELSKPFDKDIEEMVDKLVEQLIEEHTSEAAKAATETAIEATTETIAETDGKTATEVPTETTPVEPPIKKTRKVRKIPKKRIEVASLENILLTIDSEDDYEEIEIDEDDLSGVLLDDETFLSLTPEELKIYIDGDKRLIFLNMKKQEEMD